MSENIKNNIDRNIDVVNNSYLRRNSQALSGNNQKQKLSKKLTLQIPKISLKNKGEIEEGKEKNKIKEIKDEEKKENKDNVKYNNNQNKVNKYEEKIKHLEETISQINLEHEEIIKKKKILIEQKEKDIKQLLKINSNLKNSLEILTQRLDKVLINKTNKKLKNGNKEIEIDKEDLEYRLELKEKELKNQQQLINILKKDNKNVRSILNNLGYNENNINLVDKIDLQYKEMINMKKNFEEYKKKRFESQKNILSKKSTEEEKKKKKLFLNSLTPSNKSFIGVRNKNNEINIKKHEYNIISSSFNYNKNKDDIFNDEEKNAIIKYFGEEQAFKNFIIKIKILEKSSIVKEKEMNMKMKLMENLLRQKEMELNIIKNESKEKDNAINILKAQNKELHKATDDLINKLNSLSRTLNNLEQKNQIIMKKNQQIRNTIFNIDGIIEAKSKEGNTIPILKEYNNKNNEIDNFNNENNSKREFKVGSNDISNNIDDDLYM